jgi:hypothetical protein
MDVLKVWVMRFARHVSIFTLARYLFPSAGVNGRHLQCTFRAMYIQLTDYLLVLDQNTCSMLPNLSSSVRFPPSDASLK